MGTVSHPSCPAGMLHFPLWFPLRSSIAPPHQKNSTSRSITAQDATCPTQPTSAALESHRIHAVASVQTLTATVSNLAAALVITSKSCPEPPPLQNLAGND